MNTESLGSRSGISDRLNTIVNAAVNGGRVVGAVVLAALDGEIIHEHVAGWANREACELMHSDTIFRLASMTKPIVSAAALSLYEQGEIGLNDPVTKYLPEFRPRMADGHEPEVRLWRLLTHTSGLGYGFDIPSDNEPYASAGISDGIDSPGISLKENLHRLASAPSTRRARRGDIHLPQMFSALSWNRRPACHCLKLSGHW